MKMWTQFQPVPPETVKETKDRLTAQSLLLGELTCYNTSGNISHHTVQDTSDDP